MKVKPKIEGGVIKEPHGPHDLGVTRRINPKKRVKTKIGKAAQKVVVYPKIIPKRNQKHRDFTQKVYREGNGKGGNSKYKVADKFKELRTLLYKRKYKVETKECFELLCFLHNYISHNRNDSDSKNELADILHDILIEIFLPINSGEPYKKYTGEDEGNRHYFYTPDKEKEINHIYDLNIFSEVWLKDISAFYGLKSKEFPKYNSKSRIAKKAERKKNEGNIRITISRHLRAYIDPDKPIKPEAFDPYAVYKYNFLNALYEENKVKNRFFQELKYQFFEDLGYKRYAILNLRVSKYYPVEEYSEEEEVSTNWIIKLSPVGNDFLGKYSLFKDNPFVYVYRYRKEKEINETVFTPATSEYEGKVSSIDEERNIITIKIRSKDFFASRSMPFYGIVLRQDYTTYQREKQAIIDFIDKNKNLPIKMLIVKNDIPNSFYDISIKDFCNNNLNESQKIAVENAIQAKEFFCIHGPPGTGKTKTCAEIIIQSLYIKPDSRILVTCASNEATDNILESFAKILPEELHPIILRIGTEEKISGNPFSLDYKIRNSHLFSNKILQLRRKKELNDKKIDKAEDYIGKRKIEIGERNTRINQINAELCTIKDRGKRNERTIGIIPSIEKLKKSKPRDVEEAEKMIKKIKELELKRDNYQKQVKEFNITIQKRTEEITKKGEILRSIQEKNRNIELELETNKRKLKKTVINRKPVVVFSTNNHSAVLSNYNAEKFDLLVLDEITQSTVPSALIAINLSNKIVIAGDHHQLPPTVFLKNKDYDQDLNPKSEKERIECYQVLAKSLFEELYSHIKADEKHCTFLNKQYRMNPIIIPFLNQTIYKYNNLKSDPSTSDNKLKNGLFNSPVVFINHSTSEKKEYTSEEFAASKVEYSNKKEIEIITKLVKKYIDGGFPKGELGIISPYKSQVRELNKTLEPLGLIAKTVDGFQGQEREIIILSLVRGNRQSEKNIATKRIGFLVDERRFNVGITRFKSKLIIIGNEDTLTISNDPKQEYYDIYEDEDEDKNKPLYYKALIDYIKSNGKSISCEELEDYLSEKKKISLSNRSDGSIPETNTEFHNLLLKRFYDVIIKKLRHDIQLIKDNNKISKEDKIERISDKVTEALFDAPIKEKETPIDDRLAPLSKIYLRSGDNYYDFLLNYKGPDELDWGSVINNYGRALEQELLEKIFVPFKEKVLFIDESTGEINQLKKDTDLKMLVGFILKDTNLAIGNMEHILNTVIHSQKRKDLFLIKKFREFLSSLGDPTFIFSKDGLCNILRESTKYRNPSSHAGRIINRDFCEEAKSHLHRMMEKLVAAV
jgi:superfamily I DNA and/or RNA helicase